MYKLAPFFPSDIRVVPKKVIYNLPGYHNELPQESSSSAFEEVDPVKLLELKQLQLIDALNKQATKINELLVVKGKAAAADKKQPAKKSPAQNGQNAPQAKKVSTPVSETNDKGGKKDKDAKKEARKAAKADAKNKVASGAAPASNKNGQKTATASTAPAWVVYEEKKSTETGQSITANLPSELFSAKQQHLGEVTLIVTPSDLRWAQLFAIVGAKRNVTFKGVATNKVTKAQTTVNVQNGEKFQLKLSSSAVGCRITAWKVLGSALGLFSTSHTDAINAAHQHQWFIQANKALSGTGDVPFLEREVCQFLSRFDTLSANFDISIADIVVRSLIEGSKHPNNIELWAKRIDTLLK